MSPKCTFTAGIGAHSSPSRELQPDLGLLTGFGCRIGFGLIGGFPGRLALRVLVRAGLAMDRRDPLRSRATRRQGIGDLNHLI